jgi:hypothetical protein
LGSTGNASDACPPVDLNHVPLRIGEVERKRYSVIERELNRKTPMDDMLMKSTQIRQHVLVALISCSVSPLPRPAHFQPKIRSEQRSWQSGLDPQVYPIALPKGSKLRMPINLLLLDAIRSDWWRETLSAYLGPDRG